MSELMYDRKWLHDFALACRYATLEAGFEASNCIQVSRLGVDVLHRYGVDAKAQPVSVAAYTRKGYELQQRGVPISQWPDDAWSVGVMGTGKSDPDTRRWDGHLVIVVRNPNRKRTLIDLSADQMNRPQRGIHIEGPVFMDIEGLWSPKDPLFTLVGQNKPTGPTIVRYAPQVTGGGWKTSPDWLDKYEVHAELVAMVVRTLNEKYPEGIGEAS